MRTQEFASNRHLIEPLPKEFAIALAQIGLNDDFTNAIEVAATQIGHEFLFELPGITTFAENVRTVVLCKREPLDMGSALIFIEFDGDESVIKLLCEHEVPNHILRFTRSYSEFLQQAARFIPAHSVTLQ